MLSRSRFTSPSLNSFTGLPTFTTTSDLLISHHSLPRLPPPITPIVPADNAVFKTLSDDETNVFPPRTGVSTTPPAFPRSKLSPVRSSPSHATHCRLLPPT
ncbi:unnamed protein product [Microthlaspi erraticum]|uniref:Uncharacterized protein n=1 Tax=Microthlaspi erraticum TaxID=1685480 RepID=A0A6D2KA19_9BRAS|nr:unnamed protein product [Microthlaspi erraticum]